MDGAATKIQAAYRGWALRSQWDWDDLPVQYQHSKRLLSHDGCAEAWTCCDMEYYADCLTHGHYCVPFDRVHLNDSDIDVGKPFGITDALGVPMIKWLLRYDQNQFYKIADLSNAWSLVSAIHNYQAGRLCAASQVLSAKGVPRDVFAAHCGGLDIAGILRQ